MLPIKLQKYKKEAVWKVLFKKSGCTMPLFVKLTYHTALHRKKILSQLFGDWQGEFIITK